MIEEQEFYWKLLDTLQDGVYFSDSNRKITYWNKAAEEITGYRSAEVLGKFCGDNILIHIDDKGNNLCSGTCPLAAVIKSGATTEADIYLHHKDGHRVPVHVRVNPVKNQNGAVIGAVEIFSDRSFKDITAQRLRELRKMELLDIPTGLPNRRFLEMNLKIRLLELREFNLPFGILYFYVTVRQDNGSPPVAENLASAMRIISKSFINTCNLFDVIGRWGEEEFVGIFANVDRKELKSLKDFYRDILAKTDLTVTGISPLIKIGAVPAQTADTPDKIIDKAKIQI